MKILFVGVFDKQGRSTNNSQILAIKKLGHNVVGYNYREKALAIGAGARDDHLYTVVKENNFDLVLFSKCNGISYETFEKISFLTATCLWWMDPKATLLENPEIIKKSKLVDFVATAVENTIPIFIKQNKNVYFVIEGFDENIDKPYDTKKEFDVVFIGSLHSNRKEIVEKITHPVVHFTNAYSRKHAKIVSKSKICLNFSTTGGASDRVYKTLAANGFLISSDWEGRGSIFTDGDDLIIYKDIQDLNEKIDYFLKNDIERVIIANNGYKSVQKYNRSSWAQQIINIFLTLKEKQNNE